MRFSFCLLSILVSALAHAQIEAWTEFQNNPKQFMMAHPVKTDRTGAAINSYANSPFSRGDIDSGEFVLNKLKARDAVFKPNPIPLHQASEYALEANLQVKVLGFLDQREFDQQGTSPITRLEEIDKLDLKSASLADSPWSGSYWPIYQGVLGARYASPKFPKPGYEWSAYSLAITGDSSLGKVVSRGDANEINTLSPAEKYDLLIGQPKEDEQGFLTPAMWSEGQQYMDRDGKVESWMGICHGWAPASFMVPRPSHSVVAASPAVSGGVKFYPSDLKGLSSELWAKDTESSAILGDRCTSKVPAVDPESGRLLDPKCFEVNPGVWHLVVINQLGIAHRSFVIDASYDYEVWNQPMYSYSYKYFNPQTGQFADTAAQATVSKDEFTKDHFTKYRSSAASTFVGVEMKIKYVSETDPSDVDTDTPDDDAIQNVTYLYDLELDSAGNVIGGEWYHNQHPNFIWLPRSDKHAVSPGDGLIVSGSTWSPDQVLPPFWREIAINTAKRFGEPLSAIVDPMIAAAHSL